MTLQDRASGFCCVAGLSGLAAERLSPGKALVCHPLEHDPIGRGCAELGSAQQLLCPIGHEPLKSAKLVTTIAGTPAIFSEAVVSRAICIRESN